MFVTVFPFLRILPRGWGTWFTETEIRPVSEKDRSGKCWWREWGEGTGVRSSLSRTTVLQEGTQLGRTESDVALPGTRGVV